MLDPEQHSNIVSTPEQLKRKDPKIPVVFPGGQIKEIECGRNTAHRGGLTVLEFRDGRPVIRPRYEDQGFELYQKMCTRLGETDKWDLWCDMVKERDRGVNVKFPEECFCSEVVRRRQMRRGEHPEASIDFADRQKEIAKKAKARGEKPITERVTGGLQDDVQELAKGASKGEARIKERWQRAGLTEREVAKKAKEEQRRASKKAVAIQREKR